jgi:hypothetical protein
LRLTASFLLDQQLLYPPLADLVGSNKQRAETQPSSLLFFHTDMPLSATRHDATFSGRMIAVSRNRFANFFRTADSDYNLRDGFSE